MWKSRPILCSRERNLQNRRSMEDPSSRNANGKWTVFHLLRILLSLPCSDCEKRALFDNNSQFKSQKILISYILSPFSCISPAGRLYICPAFHGTLSLRFPTVSPDGKKGTTHPVSVFLTRMNMDKLLYFLSSLLLLTSCAEQYNIAGNSSVPSLDGRTMYLRVTPEDMSPQGVSMQTATVCIDSCRVVHGRFNFVGDVDSARMALLYSGQQVVMPMVIENGNLTVQVDNVAQRVSGGPLNDKLYRFFQKKNRLDNEMWELQQRTIRMIREGESPETIQRKMGNKAQKLAQRAEDLETRFVMDNYDNVLGPGFFILLCRQYPTPIMTPQIQRIADRAPSCFLSHPYVRNYLELARARMDVQHAQPIEPHGTVTTTVTITYP